MIDKVMPAGKWEFDQEVTAVFGDMLSRSIPDYEVMRQLVTRLGAHFIHNGTNVIDVGCSTGLSAAPFVSAYPEVTYHLLDVSRPMLDACSERFAGQDNVIVKHHDVTSGLDVGNASLVLSILSIQFTPIEHRQNIVKSIYDSLNAGGAFIFVEKVLGNCVEIDNLLVQEYYKLKSENQYTQEQIKAKRKSLEGVLVPLTAQWNEDMLRNVGFKKVDCFFRVLNFAGWVAIK